MFKYHFPVLFPSSSSSVVLFAVAEAAHKSLDHRYHKVLLHLLLVKALHLYVSRAGNGLLDGWTHHEDYKGHNILEVLRGHVLPGWTVQLQEEKWTGCRYAVEHSQPLLARFLIADKCSCDHYTDHSYY
jgi:hypothetical protein